MTEPRENMSGSAASWFDALRGLRFQGSDFSVLSGPLVYLALAADDSPLYVGMSRGGIGRLFSRSHHAWNDNDINQIAYFLVYPVETLREARALEDCLIHDLKPRWNKRQLLDFPVLSHRLGMSVKGVRVLAHRLRQVETT